MNLAWKKAFTLVSAAIFLQTLLGEYFYKAYLTEVVIVVAWMIISVQYIFKLKVPYIGSLYALAFLCVGYLAYSLLLGRELYWVARQGAFVLYASVAFIGYKYMRNDPDVLVRNARRLFYFGALMMMVHHLFNEIIPGHPFFTAFLIFMLGTACWVVQTKRIGSKVWVTVFAFMVSLLTNEHTTFLIIPFAILWAALFVQVPKYRIFLGVMATLGMLVLPLAAVGLSDPNATWRYLYWLGVLQESWERGWLLLGNGFGAPYMPQSLEFFDQLIEQVSGRDNTEYQLMTVPPHNGILTILIYLGLLGVLVFLLPYWRAAKVAMQGRSATSPPAPLVAAFAFLLLLASNQFVEVPYTATIFWLVYGGMLAYIKECRFVGSKMSNAKRDNWQCENPNSARQ